MIKRFLFGFCVPFGLSVIATAILIVGVFAILEALRLTGLPTQAMTWPEKVLAIISLVLLNPLRLLLQYSEAYSKGVSREEHLLSLIPKK
jgi:hypothetical protein